jgi:hypothetical protein
VEGGRARREVERACVELGVLEGPRADLDRIAEAVAEEAGQLRVGLDGDERRGTAREQLDRCLAAARADLQGTGAGREPAPTLEAVEERRRIAGPTGGVAGWVRAEDTPPLAPL